MGYVPIRAAMYYDLRWYVHAAYLFLGPLHTDRGSPLFPT